MANVQKYEIWSYIIATMLNSQMRQILTSPPAKFLKVFSIILKERNVTFSLIKSE